jgi:PST family polysaccharide transporter
MDGITKHSRESEDKASTQSRAGFAVLEILRRKVWGVRWYQALGWAGIHSLLGLVLSFVTIKFTAAYLGPSGIALVAQLGNFLVLCHGILGGGIGTATLRVYPEFGSDRAGRKRFLATAWRLGSLFAVVSIVTIALASGPLARWLLTSDDHRTAMMLAGVAVACMVLNTVIMSAINAAGEMGRLVACHAIASVIAFAVYVPASVVWGIPGGLIGFAISQSVCLPVSLAVLRWSSSVAPEDFRGRFDLTQARRIMGFVPMLIAHSIMSPLGLIMIRDMVASHLGLATAGLWQATWRISEIYLGIVMVSLGLYFPTRLGEVVGTPELREEIVRTFVRVVGIAAAAALTIFLLRDWVVRIVFTEEFLPMRDLMPFQLLGDMLAVAGWTFGFVLVALVRSHWYIALQILTPAIYFGGALYLVPKFGARGVTWAYCLAGATYIAISVFALRDVLIQGSDGHSNSRGSGNLSD